MVRWRVALVCGFLGILAIVLAKPGYRLFKMIRSNQEIAAANELLKDGDVERARVKARIAYNLSPGNLDIVRSVARVFEDVNPLTAMRLYQQVAGESGNRDDFMNVAMMAREVGATGVGISYLRSIEEPSVETELLLAELLVESGVYDEALSRLEKLVAEDNISPDADRLYVEVALGRNNDSIQRKALSHLDGLMDLDNERGREALRFILNVDGISQRLLRLAAERLRAHPLATRDDHLMVISRLFENYLLSPAVAVDEARSAFDLNDPEEVRQLGIWLNNNELANVTRDVLPVEMAMKRKDLFLVFADSLAVSERWEELEEILDRDEVPLEEHYRQLFLMRSAFMNRKYEPARIYWNAALVAASGNGNALRELANYTLRLGLEGYAEEALLQLVELPAFAPKAFEELVAIRQVKGDIENVYSLYTNYRNAFSHDHRVTNDWAYLSLVLGEDVDEASSVAADLAEQFPRTLAYRVTLALALVRRGEYVQAYNELESAGVDWSSMRARWVMIYGVAAYGAGQRSTATRLFEQLDAGSLFPVEKEMLQELINNIDAGPNPL